MSEVTRILDRLQTGDAKAAEELLPLVYGELRKLAAQKMAHEPPGQTLQPTALVHEAWFRLGGDAQPAWENRAHFLAAAPKPCAASWLKPRGADRITKTVSPDLLGNEL